MVSLQAIFISKFIDYIELNEKGMKFFRVEKILI